MSLGPRWKGALAGALCLATAACADGEKLKQYQS